VAIPTFGNVQIFQAWGLVSMTVAENPRDEQMDAYFGVNGVERKDGGSRGRVARVRGRLGGEGAAGLLAAETLFRSYVDGVPRVLTDTIGGSWAAMKLIRFVPEGEARLSADGSCWRDYSAEFEAAL
jgi:hypothetical protein